MRIFRTASGDYRVVSELPFTAGDIMSAAHQIARDDDVIVFGWPVFTDDFDGTVWQVWFLVPESDDEYLDHEVLV